MVDIKYTLLADSYTPLPEYDFKRYANDAVLSWGMM